MSQVVVEILQTVLTRMMNTILKLQINVLLTVHFMVRSQPYKLQAFHKQPSSINLAQVYI